MTITRKTLIKRFGTIVLTNYIKVLYANFNGSILKENKKL